MAALGILLTCSAFATEVKTFAVNEYFGLEYNDEPVSFDVAFKAPVKASEIYLEPGPYQVEVLEGTPEKVDRARVWTLVSFPHRMQTRTVKKGKKEIKQEVRGPLPAAERHKLYTVKTGTAPAQKTGNLVVKDGGASGKVELAVFGNGEFFCKIPAKSVTFPEPVSAFDVPGPVASVSRDGKTWVGSGYLETILRVRSLKCEVTKGPVYLQSRISYEFESGRRYTVDLRVFAGKPYVKLVEDFDLGGNARFIFNYDDWFTDAFFRTGDSRMVGWKSIKEPGPCADFIKIHGSKPLARMVIWTQFNYFGGKQETIALKSPDVEALVAADKAAMTRYEQQLERYKQGSAKYEKDLKTYEKKLALHKEDPKKNRKPRAPRQPREPRKPSSDPFAEEPYEFAGASIRASNRITPGGQGLAVGGFYIRPDRWTRPKLNHVDLYMRPEVPGDRRTRGVVGLKGAKQRIAMEAWLVDGHREWAIFAVRAGDNGWLAKAHLLEGAWPLDRINRLPLVWNADGSPVRPEETAPGEGLASRDVASVLTGTAGRAGLMHYNGSNHWIRRRGPPMKSWDGSVKPDLKLVKNMYSRAMQAYLSSDNSSYPILGVMLPWTDPDALNPFYQGMENMNFAADLYRYILWDALVLAPYGHPHAKRIIDHAQKCFDRALDTYVYPGSGCWEESHGYAGHTIKTVYPMVRLLRESGLKDFTEDPRFVRMVEFFMYVHSPMDADFCTRVVPPVGDHGLHRTGPAKRFKTYELFAKARNPVVQRVIRNVAWMIKEDCGKAPEGVKPEKPDLGSRWLQGYGTVMRAFDDHPQWLRLTLDGALIGTSKKSKKPEPRTLNLLLPYRDGKIGSVVRGGAFTFNQGTHRGTAEVKVNGDVATLRIPMTIGSDRWVKGGEAEYTVSLKITDDAAKGTFEGKFNGTAVKGGVVGSARAGESFAVLRAGQSWGHHHADKGSLWFWGRNVHFFGDAGWGGPPGGTYWNKYKQGPASGTQIEFVGINNWTLPCKYPAPWISDDEYGKDFDYANARCLYPYNPRLDLSASTPVALRNGYDRQVLFVHPDLLIVRDNVETMCKTVWRMHSYQPEGTSVNGPNATLASPQKVLGELSVLYPTRDVSFKLIDRDDLNDHKYKGPDGKPTPYEQRPKFGSSVVLRWDMPPSTSVTWTFGVHDAAESKPRARLLDNEGRVTEVKLADGTRVVAFLNIHPFTFSNDAFEFEGTVGLVIQRKGRTETHAIRAKTLKVK